MIRGPVLSAFRCLACGMPKIAAVSQWIVSPAEPTSSIPRVVSCTSSVRPLSLNVSSSNSLLPRISAPFLKYSNPLAMQTRGRQEIYYRPSAWKRVNKHGLEKRLRSPGGIEVLWRRILKKRYSLTPFDKILPGTVKGQILPDHHLKYNKHLIDRQVQKRVQQAIRKK